MWFLGQNGCAKWADKKGFTLEVLDSLDGDEAGIKSITFQVNGENAYGYLKSEKGVHRLVRISPFNAAGKSPEAVPCAAAVTGASMRLPLLNSFKHNYLPSSFHRNGKKAVGGVFE